MIQPLNVSGDTEGCTLDKSTHEVTPPKGYKEAYQQYIEGGWPALSCDPEFGGQGLPATINTGISLFFMGFGVGLALLMSAIWQGQASAAAIGLVARRESDFGRSLILPAMVETYAVVGLLAGILALNFIR